MPVAVSWSKYPVLKLAATPGIAIDINAGAFTVKVALLDVMPFKVAVIVDAPWAKLVATPLAFSVATVVLLDVQITEDVRLPVLPFE